MIASVDKLITQAEEFITLYYREKGLTGVEKRLDEVRKEVAFTETYTHTYDELEFGAKVAWRNSNRCIGRLFWKTLKVIDKRCLSTSDEVFEALLNHIGYASNEGKIRSTITIFKANPKNQPPKVRIWNPQLIRYAGHQQPGGAIIGDPALVEFTQVCKKLGWKGQSTAFDVLPVVIQAGESTPNLYSIPASHILEIPIEHPKFTWFRVLGLRWHAVPIISNMVLEIGGVHYNAAPFNGWYMLNEIASRNFGDATRYNMLPTIAQNMGLDIQAKHSLWQDRALLELNEAVLYSYKKSGVSLVDHHTASDQFMHFVDTENKQGREVNADWAWITPPFSASATQVFHQEWPNKVVSPNFYYDFPAWQKNGSLALQQAKKCPFHIYD
ncbi:nitric oxide synthase [marine bacterium AO1-C]|nr:nitric oxide synthase [marine bacterium AO1-C]